MIDNLINLGIVAALKSEARTLADRPNLAKISIRLKDNTLLRISGLGANRACAAAESLLADGATALISWGTACGLDANLLSGNLILPKRIISFDQSVSPVDAAWHESLCRLIGPFEDFHTGALAESPTVLRRPAEKRAFFDRYDAVAVDMESGSVAQIASAAQVPFIAIRAVADPLEMTVPLSALNAIDEYGRVQPLRLLHGLVRNPAELFLLIRLGRHFRNARSTLAKVARLAGDSLFGLLSRR